MCANNYNTIKPIPNQPPFMFPTNRMAVEEAPSFSALLSALKSHCFCTLYVPSDLILKAPHATCEKHYLSKLEFGVGVCCLHGICCVQCSVQKQEIEQAPTRFSLMMGRNVGMWLKTESISHTFIYVWHRPDHSSLPALAPTSSKSS